MDANQNRMVDIVRAAIVVSFSNLGDSLLYVALPLIYSSFGLNLVQVGILLSANRLVRFASNTLAGYVYGIKPLKWVLVTSIIAAFFINLSYGYIGGFLPFLTMRLLWGITWSFLRLGGYLSVVSFSDEFNRGRYMGVYQSISSIGFLSGGLVGGVLLDSWGFTSANLLLALGTFLVIPIAFSLTDKRLDVTQPEYVHKFNIRTLLGNSELFSIGVGVMLTRLFLGSLISSTLSLYLIEILGSEGITFLGWNVGIASLTGILLSFRIFIKFLLGPVIGVLSDKFGGQRTMGILFVSGSASLMMLAISQSLGIITMAVILSFLSDAGLGVVIASQVSDMVETGDADSKFTLSAFTNWIDIGSALGPLVIFSLISKISFNSIFVSASAVLLLYALVIRKAL
ncbi:MFS transporter [Candidatus Bathyarchaeota archaeon]|nr:MFS transporter [Candidatus Bathyarchaeota archaeon]